jgi:hypothetical protein
VLYLWQSLINSFPRQSNKLFRLLHQILEFNLRQLATTSWPFTTLSHVGFVV